MKSIVGIPVDINNNRRIKMNKTVSPKQSIWKNWENKNNIIKALITIAILCVAIAIYIFLNTHPPKARLQPDNSRIPTVRVQQAIPETVSIPIYTRGLITPITEITLTSEASGAIRYLSPNLKAGGSFKKGERLLAIDDTPLQNEVTRITATVVSARQRYSEIKTEIDTEVPIEGLQSPKTFMKKRLTEAQAQLNAAKAELTNAKLRLKKAEIIAPFDGRVQETAIGDGQIILSGSPIAKVHSSAGSQIRLPLSDRQLELVDLSANNRVTLQKQKGKESYYWEAHLIGAESSLDPRNRLLYVIAEIGNPINWQEPPPLWTGQLLEAEIEGKAFAGIVVLPRAALHSETPDEEQVWIVDQDNRLRKRTVAVLYKAKQTIYLAEGLAAGEQVVVSPLEVTSEGMTVQIKIENNIIGAVKQ